MRVLLGDYCLEVRQKLTIDELYDQTVVVKQSLSKRCQ